MGGFVRRLKGVIDGKLVDKELHDKVKKKLEDKKECISDHYRKERKEWDETEQKYKITISELTEKYERLDQKLNANQNIAENAKKLARKLELEKANYHKNIIGQYETTAKAMGCDNNCKLFVTDTEKFTYSSCSITQGTAFSSANIALNVLGTAPQEVMKTKKPFTKTEYDKESRLDMFIVPIMSGEEVLGSFGIIRKSIYEKAYKDKLRKIENHKKTITSLQNNIVNLKNKAKKKGFESIDKENLKSLYLRSGLVQRYHSQKIYGGVNKGGHMPISWGIKKFNSNLWPDARREFNNLIKSNIIVLAIGHGRDQYHLNKDCLKTIYLYVETYPIVDKLWKDIP